MGCWLGPKGITLRPYSNRIKYSKLSILLWCYLDGWNRKTASWGCKEGVLGWLKLWVKCQWRQSNKVLKPFCFSKAVLQAWESVFLLGVSRRYIFAYKSHPPRESTPPPSPEIFWPIHHISLHHLQALWFLSSAYYLTHALLLDIYGITLNCCQITAKDLIFRGCPSHVPLIVSSVLQVLITIASPSSNCTSCF